MDQTPTLYRVAHVSSIYAGMYRRCDLSLDLNDLYRHPMPDEDEGLEQFYHSRFDHRFYFGFGSLEQLKFWVHRQSDREALAKAGFVVYEIEPLGEKSEDWEVGDTQAVFRRHSEIGIRDLRDI